MLHAIISMGTENAAKCLAIKLAFNRAFPDYFSMKFLPTRAPSGVENTPLSREATGQGAQNRLKWMLARKELRASNGEDEYLVAIEGGFYEKHSPGKFWHTGTVLVAKRKDDEVIIVEGGVLEFPLPTEMSKRIAKGEHCSAIVDEFTKSKGTKQKLGVTGFVTDGILERVDTYYPSLIVAFNQLKHYEEMYR